MKDIGEVIRSKQSQRDRLAREIDTLQQAMIIMDREDEKGAQVTKAFPPITIAAQATGTEEVKRWP